MKKIICAALLLFSVGAEAQGLKWGGDASGGAPYIFRDPGDPSRIIGFEVELADLLANEMGKKAEFVQNQWDSLIPGLNRGNYDVVINGIEITEDRKLEVEFSDPYFISFEQLTVPKNTFDITSLANLKRKKAGTLKGSLAERILQNQEGVDTIGYDNQTTLYDDLALGRVDAVLLDQPAALYYGNLDQRLKTLPDPFGELVYGITIKKGNKTLLREVNHALTHIIESGKLREIYDRWNLWNPAMAKIFKDDSISRTEPVAYEAYLKSRQSQRSWKDKVLTYLSYVPLLVKGAVTTIELSILAMSIAIILGLLIALIRLYSPEPFSYLAMAYTEVIRGTPLLIQLFLIYYGLPNLGLKISPFPAAIFGLALNYSAYEAEVYRAGIKSIPHSQMEAALALGFSRWQALRHVIVPQALRLVIPPMTNDFISLLKDSSLVSVITMVELTRVYGQLAATYYDYFGIGILTALFYFLIGVPFVRLSRYAESRLQEEKCLKT